MIQDLVYVVDKEPDFAEAHNMLALARLQGGGVHSATESITVAIQLSPRSEQYLLNLAQIDLAGKKWDDATALLDRLKDSSNPANRANRPEKSGRPAYPEEVWRVAAGQCVAEGASRSPAPSAAENDEEDASSGTRGSGPGRARARPAQSPVRQREAGESGLQSESGGDLDGQDKRSNHEIAHRQLQITAAGRSGRVLLRVGRPERDCELQSRRKSRR